MNVTVRKLSELTRLKKNIRRHNEKQITEYMRSLEMFGQIRPMVVDEKGVIWVGNGMFEAMLRLGWENADCYVLEDMTEAQKTKLMMADNRVYELGLTDTDVFDELLVDLSGDFDIPGWDADLLETLTASMAEATEMVQNYGVFAQDEVQRVQERQREPHMEPVAPEGGNAPLQRPSDSLDGASAVGDRAEAEAARDATEATVGKYIICPHCGERIVLEPSLIGGA